MSSRTLTLTRVIATLLVLMGGTLLLLKYARYKFFTGAHPPIIIHGGSIGLRPGMSFAGHDRDHEIDRWFSYTRSVTGPGSLSIGCVPLGCTVEVDYTFNGNAGSIIITTASWFRGTSIRSVHTFGDYDTVSDEERTLKAQITRVLVNGTPCTACVHHFDLTIRMTGP